MVCAKCQHIRSGSTIDKELDVPALQPHLLAQWEPKGAAFQVCPSSAQMIWGVITDPVQVLTWITWENEPVKEMTFNNTAKAKIPHVGTWRTSRPNHRETLACQGRILEKL